MLTLYVSIFNHKSALYSCNLLFYIYSDIATGASLDWVKYELKTNVTFEYEMRDRGSYGFNLPASQIIENSIEVFASIVTILQEAQKIGIA